jgi:hypothetical protein
MIPRRDYAGPITKSARAMFARADRRARRFVPAPGLQAAPVRPRTAIRLAVDRLGLTMATLRRWEDAGLVSFERRRGRRVFDEAVIECLAVVAQLRRAGLSIKQIGWTSDTAPPSLRALKRALEVLHDP